MVKAGDAFAAADLGDAHRLAGDQPGVEVGEGGQPLLEQVVHEHGPGKGGLQIVDRVVGVGERAAGEECLDDRGIMRPASATNTATAVVLAGLSGSSSTWAWAAGSA